MPAVTLMGSEVKLILASIAALGFLLVCFYLIRLIRELIPTLRQMRRTIRELERTVQNSQEIIYNLKSISRTLDKEVADAQGIVDSARDIVDQVHLVTTTITKPISGLRNVLMGVGYGMKYLLKRNSYEEEQV